MDRPRQPHVIRTWAAGRVQAPAVRPASVKPKTESTPKRKKK
jgi:hypothetical protein